LAVSVFVSGCASKQKVTDYYSFHKRTSSNGVPDRASKTDSVTLETSSRYLGDQLLLYSKSYFAEFHKPIGVSDEVSYRNGVPDPSGLNGMKECKVDTGHMAYVAEIPFGLSDSLVRQSIGGSGSISEKIAFSYRITCDHDREEGEIHMVQSVHYETKPLGN
jgi:hypothetical protein